MRRLLRLRGPVRALVASDFAFHLGFYMLVPYVAGHLKSLGHQTATIGLVLGLRALGQQGLSLAGGLASDRFGARPVIVAGCLVRAFSFVLLGMAETLPAVTIALLASGLAAALFTPALNAYLAAEIKDDRAEIFAASTALNEVGSLSGPVLGMVLLGAGFGTVCAVSAAIFLLAGLALALQLPRRTIVGDEKAAQPLTGLALRNRRLWLFSLVVAPYFILFQQMYLLIPIELGHRTGTDRWTGIFFSASSALVVVAQVPITAACRRIWSRGACVAAGLFLMGIAFLPFALPLPALVGAALAVLLLTLGTMVAFPFVRELVPSIAGERALGAQHGIFYMVAGLAATGGNTLAGWLHEDTLAPARGPTSAWIFLALLGLGGSAAMLEMKRRRLLMDGPPAQRAKV